MNYYLSFPLTDFSNNNRIEPPPPRPAEPKTPYSVDEPTKEQVNMAEVFNRNPQDIFYEIKNLLIY